MPSDGDGLESLRRQVGLSGVKLTTLARADDLGRIKDHCGLVESLSEGISYQGLWCSVVAAHAGMDIIQQLPPLVDMDAPLKDLR